MMENFTFSIIGSIFFFVLGTIVGSFVNVVIFRLGAGTIAQGRSQCLSCGRELRSFELIPILSFIFLRGRCRTCRSRFSIQYPLVEFASGASFLVAYSLYADSLRTFSLFVIGEFVLVLATVALLIAITVYDLRHKIIPNLLVFPFIALGAVVAASRFFPHLSADLAPLVYLDLLAGLLFYLFFYSLWRISDGRSMGLGDAKLVLGIGLMLGFLKGLSAIILGFWIGAVVGILLILFSRVLPALGLKGTHSLVTMKTEIPFAPFLILGMALVFFFKIDVFSLF